MKRLLFCVFVGLVFFALPAKPQDPNNALAYLSSLSSSNQLPKLIQAANSLLTNDKLTTADRSMVLTYLGHAYQQGGDFHTATSYYEKALALLDHDGLHPAEYATILGALATLYAVTGQSDTAKHVLLRSVHLLEKAGDHHAELAIFWNDLAVIAADQHSNHEAHKSMARALAELQQATNVSPDETEALTTTQARIAEIDHNFPAAITGYQHALALWSQAHGEQNPEGGMLYVLLGGAYLEGGNIASAREMTTHGMNLLEATSGRQSARYLVAQLTYSKVLDASGSHDEAVKYRNEAQAIMSAETKRAQGEISAAALH